MKKSVGALLCATIALGIIGVNSSVKGLETPVYTQAESIYCENENSAKTVEVEERSAVNLQLRAKSSYLMDYGTGTQIYAQNETAHLPIASMCKIMTLILCFDAVDAGTLDLDETVCISERAASMGGSQVFLEANASYPVKELIKSIVVCSANDSCVAMAERLAGSEDVFIDQMNERARSLGATDTLFANCTGLPKDPQYSCAKDVALMLRELLRHEEYYEFGKVWMDKFQHPEGRYTEITNTNKLVRFYDGCDGGKTGFTNQAGFCLAATAKRKDMRVISVVIGEESSANRFEDVRTMFDYAFANYSVSPIVEANIPMEQTACVNGGKAKTVAVYPVRSSYAFTKRGEKANITIEPVLTELRAPVEKGQAAGEIVVYKDNVEIDRVALVTQDAVAKATFWDRLKDVAKNWCARK
ncbi:MAG: D-alanyl-D-alanine carboxypeptidase [Clostridia bacterium]|nr:D-alanyl-D-alanine carboxypeptidase [Clostridia bacterium]